MLAVLGREGLEKMKDEDKEYSGRREAQESTAEITSCKENEKERRGKPRHQWEGV